MGRGVEGLVGFKSRKSRRVIRGGPVTWRAELLMDGVDKVVSKQETQRESVSCGGCQTRFEKCDAANLS